MSAQTAEPMHHHTDAEPPSASWNWTADGAMFFGYNYQHRKFNDFDAWESQNWFMLTGRRPLGPGRLTVEGMLSLEALTMQGLGSPQAFQTGEMYRGAPLIDYQHPHDFVMGLGAAYRVERCGIGYTLGASLVGSPAIGPMAFMHRESARDNPQAPLSHHYLDSTHVTPGVLTGGVDARGVRVEASWFRGAEPDDRRFDIERPRFDSWSTRVFWTRGSWQAQASGAHLHRPEAITPYDATRLTASVGYTGLVASRRVAVTAAWGENREIHGMLDAVLLEWDVALARGGTFYGRGELAEKDILDLGPDPPGFFEPHRISRVGALTLGYVHDVASAWRGGRLGIGGDVTVYAVATNLAEPYGAPHSFHAFLRVRPRAGVAHTH